MQWDITASSGQWRHIDIVFLFGIAKCFFTERSAVLINVVECRAVMLLDPSRESSPLRLPQTHWLTHSLGHSLTHSHTHTLTHLHSQSYTHTLTHPHTHLVIHLLTQAQYLTYVHIHSLTFTNTNTHGKNVEFPHKENIFSEFFKKLKVSDYYRKSESFRFQNKSENFFNP